ncbi:Lrp/AsnC family transcriptional regulator [bacterium]|nr:Lrp/AsnC family transcriptional regulator [bacterium]
MSGDLSQRDNLVLGAVQSGFPAVERPFAEIGRSLGLSEQEVLDTLRSLVERRVIRRFGAVFDSHRLGYVSTLVAVRIPEPERLPEVAAAVGRYLEVTHNYERTDRFNLWFTLIAESPARMETILAQVAALPGVAEVRSLPQLDLYKVRAEFRPLEGGGSSAAGEED